MFELIWLNEQPRRNLANDFNWEEWQSGSHVTVVLKFQSRRKKPSKESRWKVRKLTRSTWTPWKTHSFPFPLSRDLRRCSLYTKKGSSGECRRSSCRPDSWSPAKRLISFTNFLTGERRWVTESLKIKMSESRLRNRTLKYSSVDPLLFRPKDMTFWFTSSSTFLNGSVTLSTVKKAAKLAV